MNSAIQREESLFDAARGLKDPASRSKFLAEACGQDQTLRAKVEELLNASEGAEEFFQGCTRAISDIAVAVGLPPKASNGNGNGNGPAAALDESSVP